MGPVTVLYSPLLRCMFTLLSAVVSFLCAEDLEHGQFEIARTCPIASRTLPVMLAGFRLSSGQWRVPGYPSPGATACSTCSIDEKGCSLRNAALCTTLNKVATMPGSCPMMRARTRTSETRAGFLPAPAARVAAAESSRLSQTTA